MSFSESVAANLLESGFKTRTPTWLFRCDSFFGKSKRMTAPLLGFHSIAPCYDEVHISTSALYPLLWFVLISYRVVDLHWLLPLATLVDFSTTFI